MMIWRTAPAAFLLVLAVAGCDRGRPAAGRIGEKAASAPAGTLALLLDVPATVRAGEEVPLAVTLVNRGAAPASLAAVQPDIVVTRPAGGEVWRRSRHEPAAPGAATTLRPNEMRGSGSAWDQRDDAGRPVAPGSYRVRAEATALDLVSEPRMVTIQP
jgi:hypothetical protein